MFLSKQCADLTKKPPNTGREHEKLCGNIEMNERVVIEHPSTPLQDLHLRVRNNHSAHIVVIPARQEKE